MDHYGFGSVSSIQNAEALAPYGSLKISLVERFSEFEPFSRRPVQPRHPHGYTNFGIALVIPRGEKRLRVVNQVIPLFLGCIQLQTKGLPKERGYLVTPTPPPSSKGSHLTPIREKASL